MPNPCAPFAFCNCFGPYLFEIRISLPTGYEDRIIEEGGDGWPGRYSELERALNTAYDQHPTRMLVRQHGGETVVECGATRVYRKPADPPPIVSYPAPELRLPLTNALPQPASPPPDNAWLVETSLHSDALPVGYRRRVDELLRQWLSTLTTIPLPAGAGDITVEVVGLSSAATKAGELS